MKFRKKGELLEYLGKDKKDVRLIDRMIVRGEVKRENSMYIYEDDKEVIEWLKKENDELKKGIKNLTDKIEQLENELANTEWGMDYSEIVHRIYVYLREVLHINVRYDDLVEFIENYPSD